MTNIDILLVEFHDLNIFMGIFWVLDVMGTIWVLEFAVSES